MNTKQGQLVSIVLQYTIEEKKQQNIFHKSHSNEQNEFRCWNKQFWSQ